MPDISASKLDSAIAMRAQGTNWKAIGRALGVDGRAIRRRLDPEWAKQQVKRDVEYKQRKIYAGWRERARTTDNHWVERRPSPQEVAALRRLIPPDTRDLTARLLGDPVPQRSALFQKLSGASA